MAVMRIALVVIYVGNLAASILHFSHVEHTHNLQSGHLTGRHAHAHAHDHECTQRAPQVAFERTAHENHHHGHCLFSEYLFQNCLNDLFLPVSTTNPPPTTDSFPRFEAVRTDKQKLTLIAPKHSPPA
jgi:hypothetical protein